MSNLSAAQKAKFVKEKLDNFFKDDAQMNRFGDFLQSSYGFARKKNSLPEIIYFFCSYEFLAFHREIKERKEQLLFPWFSSIYLQYVYQQF